jgi:hypothetical protein
MDATRRHPATTNRDRALLMTQSTAITTQSSGSVFSGIQAFEDAQRIAKALASSTLIPPQFQGQQGFANCLVALEIANRMGISPFLAMQHLHVIHGRPSGAAASSLRWSTAAAGTARCDLRSAALATAWPAMRSPLTWPAIKHCKGQPSRWRWQRRKDGLPRRAEVGNHARADDSLPRGCILGSAVCQRPAAGLQTQEEAIDVQQVTVRAEVPTLDDLNAKITTPEVAVESDDDIF